MGPPETNAITMEKIAMSGQRIAMRMIIMNACWTLVTSVVSRVTSELVENRSMLENENPWIL